MTLDEINTVLSSVTYADWGIKAYPDGERSYLQIRVDGTCNVTGAPLKWSGRKWRLSPHMTKSEIVGTAFKAVITALEHEAREMFKYRGQAIFDGHFDVDVLHGLCILGGYQDERSIEPSPPA